MGNCQASEAATVVIQHPGGKVDRFFWPMSASDVMKSNPGYCVALVTLYVSDQKRDDAGSGTVRFTRVRLLKPKDMLLLGQVYRLITTQEVTKALRQRKHDKLKKSHSELTRNQQQEQMQHTARQRKVVQKNQEQQHSENAHQVTGKAGIGKRAATAAAHTGNGALRCTASQKWAAKSSMLLILRAGVVLPSHNSEDPCKDN